MTAAALLDEILRLPPADRLRLLEEIRDSLAGADRPIPDWHREELDRRDADPSDDADLSLEEVTARFRSAKK
jgi:putative addiction module component (TIGR02574 family)